MSSPWFPAAAAAQGCAMVVVLTRFDVGVDVGGGGDGLVLHGSGVTSSGPSWADYCVCFGLACLLGFGDGVWNTHISSVIGSGGVSSRSTSSYKPSAGFATWKTLQGIAASLAFACGPHLSMRGKTWLTLSSLAAAMAGHVGVVCVFGSSPASHPPWSVLAIGDDGGDWYDRLD